MVGFPSLLVCASERGSSLWILCRQEVIKNKNPRRGEAARLQDSLHQSTRMEKCLIQEEKREICCL